MKPILTDILIIGGGLTGLVLAYLLKSTPLNVTIIEARDRLGGRIKTNYLSSGGSIEMGATWFGAKHTALIRLLDELNITIFEQLLGATAIYEPISTSPPQLVTLPPNDAPSFRIKGGSTSLINKLAGYLDESKVYTNQVVESIISLNGGVRVSTKSNQFHAAVVVSTIPPYLLYKTINVTFPADLKKVVQNTHTWMGDSIKIGLTYPTPFWEAENLSGTIFSNVGPIPEMYDHSNIERSSFALKGFLNGAYYAATKLERQAIVLRQLEKYYGKKARDFIRYEEAIWRNEQFTFNPYDAPILPHQNNGHSLFLKAYLDGKLYIAGSETAALFPGYMEGAVNSANWVYQQLTTHFDS